jgi:hypothetical protein
MNSQQQLSAIYPDFGAMSQSVVFSAGALADTSFFDRLADISYLFLLKIRRNSSRFAYQSVWLLGSYYACLMNGVPRVESAKLNNIVNNGFRIVTDQLNAQTELRWTMPGTLRSTVLMVCH